MKKIIVCDIDDTLIRRNKQILNEDIQALKNLKNNGHEVVLATGRNYTDTIWIENVINTNNPLILLQGGIIKSNKGIEINYFINQELVKKIVDWCNLNHLTFSIVDPNYHYYLSYAFSDVFDMFPPIKVVDDIDFSHVIHIVVYFKNKNEKKMFSKFIGPEKLIARMHTNMAICHSLYTDKGLAIRKIANIFQWDMDNVISIGNLPSDSALLDESAIFIDLQPREKSSEYYFKMINNGLYETNKSIHQFIEYFNLNKENISLGSFLEIN